MFKEAMAWSIPLYGIAVSFGVLVLELFLDQFLRFFEYFAAYFD